MPHLRFSRDKRGYENTFVVHAGRRKGKSRSRILYWFRTPPGVRVGRAALDEDAIRLIEEHNPEVEFDWTRILKGQGVETKPAPSGRERFERGGRRRPDPRGPSQAPAGQTAPPAFAPPALLAESGVVEPAAVESIASEERIEAELAAEDLGASDREQEDADGEVEPVAAEPQDEMPLTPAHARLGSEGVLRLRARHAEVRARISERIQDPARQDELKTQAERLNPDTWVTDAEVSAGLEEYETVFEALRTAVGGPGRGRRQKRRRGGGQMQPAIREPEGPQAEDS